MSTLLFWQGKGKANGAPNGRNWLHAPDALVKGHVAYLVKFLGCTQVDQPKGIEVVKDAIKKLQFTQQLKKSEAKDSAKCKKVEITISVDGVAIQEPRSNNIMYQFPLHRISYCADDKGAKKYFSFIAKGGSTVAVNNGHDAAEKHECFVFVSTKLASEITLTIGQAFDLAYRRFLNDNGKYIEMQKLSLQNKKLELQMNAYKNRLQELSKITYKDDLSAYLARSSLSDITEFKAPADLEKQLASLTLANGFSAMNGNKTPEIATDALSNNSTDTFNSSNDNNLLLSTPPPQHNGKTNFNSNNKPFGDMQQNKNPVVGTKLENLLIDSDSDSEFDPRAYESEPSRYSTPIVNAVTSTPPLLAPPPKASKRQTTPQQSQQPQHTSSPINGSDIFGSTPFSIPSQNIQPPQIQSPFAPQNTSKPNYDISDFNLQTSVFNSSNTSFTNGLSGYDPFETQKNGNNIFGNGYGNTFNGFGNLSEKQTVELNSSFNGFLDKTISEMKDGFSRGITFGNDDFSIDNLDPFKKN